MTGARRSRRVSTLVIAAVLIIGVAAYMWLAAQGRSPHVTSGADPAAESETTSAPGIPPRPADAFAVTVTHVFDGDTIEARVSTANDVVTTDAPIRIRLIGVDTPEGTPTPECWADEARDHLSELLPPGSTAWAAPDDESWDDYRRRLFYLWTDDGRFVNHELVRAGDAEAIRVWPNVAHFELLSATQAEAEAAGAGRWGACD